MFDMLKAAKAAKQDICKLTTAQKNAALEAMADALIANETAILQANELDMEFATATLHNSFYFRKNDNKIDDKKKVAEAFEELINELLASKSPKNGHGHILIMD